MRVSVLTYHDVVHGHDDDASGFPGRVPAHYKLEWEHFIDHLDRIDQATARTPDTVDDLLASGTEPGSWSITFDDGGSSAVEISEELARRGWRGHFFIVTDLVGRRGFLAPDEIRALFSRGHVIGSHSCSHPERMSAIGWSELLREWQQSRQALSELLGTPITSASIPGGYYSREVARAAAAAGFAVLYTSEPTSRVRPIDGCRVIGRYMIHRDVDSRTAADLASARLAPRLRQQGFWNARKILKKIAPRAYLQMRARLLSRRAR
jgi:peptidoglycan/xylan/chitin deacetylase (PgdA/CDA1 family)